MNERGRNESDISRYTDVEYSPEGYKTVYRWGDFLEIAGGHVYNAMDTIDLVSTGGEYEGFNPRYAYTCEFVGCSTLVDGIALFRPVSRDGEDLTQIAFLRSDIDDDTGAYTECFEAGSFDIAAASDIQCSDLGIDLLDYFRGRSFEGLSGVKRGLNGREAVGAVEVATGCDLDLFEDFWLGSPGETDVHVGPYVKRDLIALSYIVNDFSQMYGTTARDIRKLLARVNNFHPDRLAAVKAYLDCEYVTDRDTSDEKTYRWSDFLEIAGGDARYAAMLIERTAPGEPQEGLHPETLVDQDIRDGEAFMLAGRPIAPEDIYDLPGTVHGLYSELVDNVGRSGTLARDWRGFSAGTDADDVLREIDGAFGETEYSRAGTVLGAYADDTFMSPFFAADDAARDVTPLTPWEDENGVAFLSRTFDADEPKPAPEFFIPPNRAPRPVVCLDTGETFESAFQAGRVFGITPGGVRTSASTGVERGGLHFYYGDEPKPTPEFFRERHSKTRPIVCLETGETFMGNPAAARPLHVSPTAISQAVRYGSPVNGLHFYHGDEPKPAPEFFKPAKVKGGKSPAAIAAAAKVAAGNSAPGTDYREHGIQRNRRAVQ